MSPKLAIEKTRVSYGSNESSCVNQIERLCQEFMLLSPNEKFFILESIDKRIAEIEIFIEQKKAKINQNSIYYFLSNTIEAGTAGAISWASLTAILHTFYSPLFAWIMGGGGGVAASLAYFTSAIGEKELANDSADKNNLRRGLLILSLMITFGGFFVGMLGFSTQPFVLFTLLSQVTGLLVGCTIAPIAAGLSASLIVFATQTYKEYCAVEDENNAKYLRKQQKKLDQLYLLKNLLTKNICNVAETGAENSSSNFVQECYRAAATGKLDKVLLPQLYDSETHRFRYQQLMPSLTTYEKKRLENSLKISGTHFSIGASSAAYTIGFGLAIYAFLIESIAVIGSLIGFSTASVGYIVGAIILAASVGVVLGTATYLSLRHTKLNPLQQLAKKERGQFGLCEFEKVSHERRLEIPSFDSNPPREINFFSRVLTASAKASTSPNLTNTVLSALALSTNPFLSTKVAAGIGGGSGLTSAATFIIAEAEKHNKEKFTQASRRAKKEYLAGHYPVACVDDGIGETYPVGSFFLELFQNEIKTRVSAQEDMPDCKIFSKY